MSYKLSPMCYSISLWALGSSLCIFLVLFVFFSIAHADVYDVLSHFHAFLNFQEDYSDNINLTHSNRQEDWITTIYPGLRFSTSHAATTPSLIQQAPTESSGVDLQYRLGSVSYAEHAENNYISQDGTLNAWYTLDRKLTFRLREYLIRSEEPLEREYTAGALPNQYLLGIQNQRAIYTRNVLEPSIGYQFGKENRFDLYYRNNTYENENPSFEGSRENYINPRLTYWFDIHNGMTLDYGLTRADFDRSPDFWGQTARARYTYRFDPQTSIFGEYKYSRRDFESPGIDYDIDNPSIGIEHAFSPTLTGKLQVGYFWENPKIGSSINGITYDANLTQRAEKTTYVLSFQGGYTEVYFVAQNLGFAQYYRSIGTISHRLMERMTVGISGSIERPEYPSSGQKDWIWMIGGNASYQILRWLTISLQVYHRDDNSNLDTASYAETRGIFRLSAMI